MYIAALVVPAAVFAEQRSLPSGLEALDLPGGHRPAVFAAPDRTTPPPWPLAVVLHGNYDRPEWECDLWAPLLRSNRWVLCPRGVPRADANRALDRWTYRGRGLLGREIEAAVAALESRFPGEVRRDDALLVGFSLGANMTPRLLLDKVLPFRSVVLVEGGFGVTTPLARTARARGVERVVYLCGARTACPGRARGLVKTWRAGRIPAEVIVMPKVGHGYPEVFEPVGRRALKALAVDGPGN